jgi:hypothetical protein
MAAGESAWLSGDRSLLIPGAREEDREGRRAVTVMEEKGNCFLFVSCVGSGREENNRSWAPHACLLHISRHAHN